MKCMCEALIKLCMKKGFSLVLTINYALNDSSIMYPCLFCNSSASVCIH